MENEKNKEQILIVDDAPDTLEILQRNLLSHRYKVFTANNAIEAIKLLESVHVDLVITDYKMPDVNGLELIRHIKENYKDIEVMMITGYATIDGAVQALKTGATEYLPKPFTDKELYSTVKNTIDKLQLRKANQITTSSYKSNFGIFGESKAILKVIKAINKASSISATVLISGESGTGKELVARAIHYNSKRASAPFVPVNCGGIPETLLESELFGYTKGSFTGATETRAGFFQTADGGSIFLDEISETSITMQVKLLRVLQDKEVCMVGSRKSQKIDIRIIAATNKSLIDLVKKNEFREDLFYRLNVITIEVPPLRDRENDIILLSNYFLSKFSKEIGKDDLKFSENTLKVLKNYYWPGNVRELENVIQRLVVMTDENVIDGTDLPSLMRFSALNGTGFNRSLQEIENEYIINVLMSVDGNKSRAADILGIDRKTLREKLKKIGKFDEDL